MSDAPPSTLECRSYTHARRYPLVLGRIGGFTLPTPLSPAQLAVLVGSFLSLLATADAWGWLFPGIVRLLVMVGVPLALTWALRHLRLEGRSPLRMLLGFLSLAAQPRHGIARGRAVRHGRARQARTQIRVLTTGHPAPRQRDELHQVVPVGRGWSCLASSG